MYLYLNSFHTKKGFYSGTDLFNSRATLQFSYIVGRYIRKLKLFCNFKKENANPIPPKRRKKNGKILKPKRNISRMFKHIKAKKLSKKSLIFKFILKSNMVCESLFVPKDLTNRWTDIWFFFTLYLLKGPGNIYKYFFGRVLPPNAPIKDIQSPIS